MARPTVVLQPTRLVLQSPEGRGIMGFVVHKRRIFLRLEVSQLPQGGKRARAVTLLLDPEQHEALRQFLNQMEAK